MITMTVSGMPGKAAEIAINEVLALRKAEKAWKIMHFAIGANFDNDAPALINQDCLVLNPSMWVDEEQIMKGGDLLL